MKKSTCILIFIAGLIIGALSINYLNLQAHTAYYSFLKTRYELEQRDLAKENIKKIQLTQAAHHLINALTIMENGAFTQDDFEKQAVKSFTFPLAALWLNAFNKLVISTDSDQKIEKSIMCAKISLIFEHQGDEVMANYYKKKANEYHAAMTEPAKMRLVSQQLGFN